MFRVSTFPKHRRDLLRGSFVRIINPDELIENPQYVLGRFVEFVKSKETYSWKDRYGADFTGPILVKIDLGYGDDPMGTKNYCVVPLARISNQVTSVTVAEWRNWYLKRIRQSEELVRHYVSIGYLEKDKFLWSTEYGGQVKNDWHADTRLPEDMRTGLPAFNKTSPFWAEQMDNIFANLNAAKQYNFNE